MAARSGPNDFLVMESIGGCAHRDLVAEQGKLQVRELKPIFAQLCEVIGYVHNRGIVHHELSMSNIVLTALGVIKLIDFGLAWNRNLVDPIAEACARIQGTLETIAPGQIKGVRSEIYARGDPFGNAHTRFVAMEVTTDFEGTL